MKKAFNTQSLLKIELDTEYNLDQATDPKILYRKPDGSTGEWEATIEDEFMVYSVSNTDIDQAGQWLFQTAAIIATKRIFGTKVKQVFQDIIEVQLP